MPQRSPSTSRYRSAVLLVLFAAATSSVSAGASQADGSAPAQCAAADTRDSNVFTSGRPHDRSFVKKFAVNALLDQKEIWTAPFHLHADSARWWLLAGASTAALMAADHPVSQALPFRGTSTDFGKSASRAGQWYTVFPAAGAFLGAGALMHNDKLQETGAVALEALAGADVVTNVLKVVARRQRPRDGDHGGHFEKGGSSFPSGHSTQAWALATVLASEYGNHRWVPLLSYGYAALVSTSRVLAQDHFSSDVFAGAAIGFFIGRLTVRTQQIHKPHALPCLLPRSNHRPPP